MIVTLGIDLYTMNHQSIEYLLFDMDLESLNSLRHYGDSFGYQSYTLYGLGETGIITQIHFVREDIIL